MADENIVNLSALYVPIMAETSKLLEQMPKVGAEAGAIAGTAWGNTFNITIKAAAAKAEAESLTLGQKMGTGLLQGFQRSGIGSQLTGMMGGLNLEKLGVVAGFAAAVVGAEKLGKALLDVGLEFEGINRQVTLMTTATGPQLEKLKDQADNLVGTIDTSTKNLGSDFATLSQRLHLTGDELSTVTRHVEEMRDRFGDLNVSNLAGAMLQFGVVNNQVDNTLASLVRSSREFGVSLGKVINDVAEAGPALRELGLSAQQAGYMMSAMESMGLGGPAGPQMLARAEKENIQLNQKLGLHRDLGQFITDENKIITDLGNSGREADAQQESFLVYGLRNWPLATAAAAKYVEARDKNSNELKQQGKDIDDLTKATESLTNAWTKVYNTLKSGIRPELTWMVDKLGHAYSGLDKLLHDFPHIKVPGLGYLFGAPPPDWTGTSNAAPPAPPPAAPGAPPPLHQGQTWVPDAHKHGGGTWQGAPAAPAPPGAPAPAAPAPGGSKLSGFNWDAVAQAESSGRWDDPNSGGYADPVYGGLQFKQATWDMFGGREFADRPDHASREQQIIVADRTAFTGYHGVPPQGLGAWETVTQGKVPGVTTSTPRGTAPGASGSPAPPAPAAPPSGGPGKAPWHWTQGNAPASPAPVPNPGGGSWVPGPGATSDSLHAPGHPGWTYSGASAPAAASGGPPALASTSGISGGGLNLSTIPISVQKYANDCIDASARIILSHSGVNMSEDQLESVIAPGGTIESQAAGMNKLAPGGGFKAMQGSGGSQQAMFNAIKASIDNGTGSILNVAPGSSLAGRNFGEGHFIAVTGYNADGTINVSDTARGTKYTVTAADAFQATAGRGIVAGTGSGPPASRGGGVNLSSFDFPLSPHGGGGGGGGFPKPPKSPDPYKQDETQVREDRGLRDAREAVEDWTTAIRDDTDNLKVLGKAVTDAEEALMHAAPGSAEAVAAQKDLTDAQRAEAAGSRKLIRDKEKLGDAQDDLRIATDKENDPSGKGGGAGGGGYSAAEQFGGGLLKGLLSSIGLPDVFGGKSPLDWGTTKIGMGLLNWGLSGLHPGKLQGGAPPGFAGGPSDLGVSRGANFAGQPGGQPGGPHLVSYDQSINIQHTGPEFKAADLHPIKNSYNRQQFQPGMQPA
jgi:hypothetical protein